MTASEGCGSTTAVAGMQAERLLVIHYESAEEFQAIVLRVLDISPDAIRVRWGGREIRMTRSDATPPNASNQAMQRTPKAFELLILSLVIGDGRQVDRFTLGGDRSRPLTIHCR